MRLGRQSGSIDALTLALITFTDTKFGFQFSETAMQKLGLEEGSRVDFTIIDDELYVTGLPASMKEVPTSLSKKGKTQHETIYSALLKTEFGRDGQWLVTNDTKDFDGDTWHKITPQAAPDLSVPSKPAIEPAVSEAPIEQVPVECTNECETPCEEHSSNEEDELEAAQLDPETSSTEEMPAVNDETVGVDQDEEPQDQEPQTEEDEY